ncbi:peroxide stress protein YaaA [Parvularcula flava]|uniref:UPF0246 protein FF098_013670 n=1 Tax=Aquisalinus luteolus TaxID=1566827 RepID=A0A8J3A5D0_9PROT|nr:peroxide stress protein YaaA [Aquisalinus luteolus]NHK28966.1 peroxide stress protein YaaA [Aquisalinus luteolus]GGI00717.1 UPF0246 protein [Aquisalinus luteolus]
MIILLSPAKNLDFSPSPDNLEATKPTLSKDTNELASVTRDLTRADLSRLMGISDKLADLNFERFQAFKARGKPAESKQAVLAFNGDVYQGLEAETLNKKDLDYAQNHLRILSGLYGILRPLDVIQPYRLEMGTKLANPRGENLYDFWGEKIAKEINKALKGQQNQFVLNLASNEYFKAVDTAALKAPVITPQFKEEKDGQSRMLMFYAKRARGMMAKWAIENRVDTVEGLKDFNVDGYTFRKSGSDDNTWLFARPQPEPKGASKAA